MEHGEQQNKTQPGQPNKRLGRGISGLLRGSASGRINSQKSTPEELEKGMEIQIDQIDPNPYQPRKTLDEDKLQELCQSIQKDGVLQPLIVTRSRQPDRYVLIAGHRRLQAARLGGHSSVPCVIKEATDRQMQEWAIIENIQRSDLNPVDKALGYKDYMDRFGLTQNQVAERMGQSRPTIANHLRILDLEDETKQLLAAGQLSFGHARVLAALTEDDQIHRQISLAHKIERNGLSVRQLEQMVTGTSSEKKSEPTRGKKRDKLPYISDMENQLSQATGLRVTIQPGKKENSGRISIEYSNLDQFDQVSALLGLQIDDVI